MIFVSMCGDPSTWCDDNYNFCFNRTDEEPEEGERPVKKVQRVNDNINIIS